MEVSSSNSSMVSCPRAFDCDPPKTSFDIGDYPSYVAIASSSLSCLGSALILLTYCLLRDMRTGAQRVITLLAVADFFTAFGYIIGSTNFLIHYNVQDTQRCQVFENLCVIQSFITTWSTMSSYCWTCILAFYFSLVIVFDRSKLAVNLIPLYNVIAWAGPLTIMIPLLAFGKLGYAPYVASNWCYIKDNDYSSKLRDKGEVIAYILIAGKFWEVCTYVFILILYILIRIHISKTQQQISHVDPHLVPKIGQVEKRLLAIPLLYIFLRMWGTLQFFYSLAVSNTNIDGCIPKIVWIVYMIFGILQAIGDGGQGWCNALLYVFFSPTIRRRMFVKPCEQCLRKVGDQLQELIETDVESNVSRRSAETRSLNLAEDTHNTAESEKTPLATAVGYAITKYSSTTTETGPQNIQSFSPSKSSEV